MRSTERSGVAVRPVVGSTETGRVNGERDDQSEGEASVGGPTGAGEPAGPSGMRVPALDGISAATREAFVNSPAVKAIADAMAANFEVKGLTEAARAVAQSAIDPVILRDAILTPATQRMIDSLRDTSNLNLTAGLWTRAINDVSQLERKRLAAPHATGDDEQVDEVDEDEADDASIALAQSMVSQLEFIGGVLGTSMDLARESAASSARIAVAAEATAKAATDTAETAKANAEIADRNDKWSKRTFWWVFAVAALTLIVNAGSLIVAFTNR